MIKTLSKRLLPPYSGQIQIAESDKYRALTIDAQTWEIQYVNRTHVRVATLSADEISTYAQNPDQMEEDIVDDQIIELLKFLAAVELPFEPTDRYEYWLLDKKEQAPLALIFSCTEAAQMEKFPARPEWTALPAAVMPIAKTEEEEQRQAPPVNYRLELLVSERAGTSPKGAWFERHPNDIQTSQTGNDQNDSHHFPPLMVREDWPEPADAELCQRYLQRQAPRLLMLHGLDQSDRARLEDYSRRQAMEVARFCSLYPEILDTELVQSLRVQARLRAATEGQPKIHSRRDGVLYI